MVVAFSMLALFATPAMGDPLPPQTGSLTIHKYSGPGNDEGTGKDLFIPDTNRNIPLNGVVFKIYRVDISGPQGMPPAGKLYSTDGVVLSVSNTATTWPVDLIDIVTTEGDGITGGSVKSEDLPQGVYYVEEDFANSTDVTNALTGDSMTVSSPIVSFLVSVPMTDSKTGAGTGWITDVHVYPKNNALGITKTTSWDAGTAIQPGDVIPWNITAIIPGDVAEGKYSLIVDQFDEALTLNRGSIAVTTSDNITLNEGEDAHYTITYDANNMMTLSFTKAGITALKGKDTVTVNFTTTVNSKILDRATTIIENEAEAVFDNNTGEPHIVKTEDPVELFTGAIRITKTDSDKKMLKDAVFQLADSESDALAGKFIRIDPVTGKFLKPGDTGYDNGKEYKATSGADGIALFMGLPYVAGSTAYKTYYLVETTAPQGYNLLTAPQSIVFNDQVIEHTYYLGVVNTKGFTLPSTGGMGSIIFTVVGIAIIGTAVIVALSRKRKNTDSKK
jgi:fimbrial isopeptide formation D2 family protein/LPXTG-motif cell wall-anchored protein